MNSTAIQNNTIPDLSADLDNHVGKHISKLCNSSLAKINSQNHCAHFVSHALEVHKKGTADCKTFTYNDKHNPAVKSSFIRVNEIFNNCKKRGKWDQAPISNSYLLIYATRESNIDTRKTPPVMQNHPVKHIGIYHKGYVWHYSNTLRKVKKDLVSEWINTFTRAYADKVNPENKVVFYYGVYN